MNQTAIPLAGARFWVRPYEFEGDGSHGGAENLVTLDIGGKTRSFWLKTLENRLFFREVGRDETWNFGALETLESDDLPLELARVLANENYGRVVLTTSTPRPCYLLAAPDGRVRCGVPQNSLHAFFECERSHTMWNNHFLDWRPGAFYVISTYHALYEKVPGFWQELANIPVPLLPAYWAIGSRTEWERTLQALFFCFWPEFTKTDDLFAVQWNLQSACMIKDMAFRCEFEFANLTSHGRVSYPLPTTLQSRLRYVRKQNLFIGQEGGYYKITPSEISGIIRAPTHHEILEAHLFLREWINERLPPAKARRWLEL